MERIRIALVENRVILGDIVAGLAVVAEMGTAQVKLGGRCL